MWPRGPSGLPGRPRRNHRGLRGVGLAKRNSPPRERCWPPLAALKSPDPLGRSLKERLPVHGYRSQTPGNEQPRGSTGSRPLHRVVAPIPEGLAAAGRDGRPDGGRRGHSQGLGLCDDCRTPRPGGTLHGISTHADLRGPRDLSSTQRKHHHNDRHSDRGTSRPGCPGGRSGVPHERFGHTDAAGRGHAGAGILPPAGVHRQLHLRTRTDRLQGRDRAGDRGGPNPENPGHPFSERAIHP